MSEQVSTVSGKLASNSPYVEDFDLLDDFEENTQEEDLPRNSIYVKTNGRVFLVTVREVEEEHPTQVTFDELHYFILNHEVFTPRTACEGWLEDYLESAGIEGAGRQELMEAGHLLGYSEKTIGRAAKRMGVRYKRQGFGGPTRWYRH